MLKTMTRLITQYSSQILQWGSDRPSPYLPEKPWWVRIDTQNPICTYYFGPFDNMVDAVIAQFGYIEDLEQENAQNIKVVIDQFSPDQLTIEADPALSLQSSRLKV